MLGYGFEFVVCKVPGCSWKMIFRDMLDGMASSL